MFFRGIPVTNHLSQKQSHRKCVLKDEKPTLPIVLVNEKGLISEGGLRGKLMKDIQVRVPWGAFRWD